MAQSDAQSRDIQRSPRTLAELNTWVKQGDEPALEPALPIIDAHHHMFDDYRGRYLLPDILADLGGHNIVASVLVETTSMYRADGPPAMRPIGEVEFANGIAAMCASGNYGNSRLCAAIVGHADLTLGDEVQPVLEALIAAGNGRMRGIRYGVAWSPGNARAGKRIVPRHLMLDPAYRKGFARVAALGLSFDAWLFYDQAADLIDLLNEYPEANVILCHTGGLLQPRDGNRDEVYRAWRSQLSELARFPNLSFKVGGLGMPYGGWDFHLRDLPPSSEKLADAWRPYVETCIELFGVERCMLESNFPPDKQSCGYGVLWNAFKRITRDCSATEKAALYHDTAARVYRIAV